MQVGHGTQQVEAGQPRGGVALNRQCGVETDDGRTGWQELCAWYRGPLGRRLARCEVEAVRGLLMRLFGYHLLVIGNPTPEDIVAEARTVSRHRADFLASGTEDHADCVVAAGNLPFSRDSVDVVVLPHLLEFVGDPYGVLREIERILVAEGHLIVLGFNPLSIWGLRRILTVSPRPSPWSARSIGVRRMRDWLSFLGLDTASVCYAYHGAPVESRAVVRRLAVLERIGRRWWPMLGASYVLLARKRVSTLTPIRPRWRSRRLILPQGVAGGASRQPLDDVT